MSFILAMTNHALLRPALAVLTVLGFCIYLLLNRRDERASILTTRLDDKIPFWPAFSIPYLLFLPYLLFITIYGVMASDHYAHIAASALAIQLAAALVYYLHQTHMPRPVVPRLGLFNRLTTFIYSHDEPYCAFPSLHVAYSVYCAYWSAFLFPYAAPALFVLTAAIIASTMFLKQHAIADVLGGLLLASLSLRLLG